MPCNYSLDFPTQQYLQHLHDTVICFWHRTYIKWPPSSKRHYFSLVNEVTVFTRSWYGLAYITTSCVCVSFCVGVWYWYAVNKCINWSSWFFGVTVAKDEIYFALHGSRNQHNKKDISPRGVLMDLQKVQLFLHHGRPAQRLPKSRKYFTFAKSERTQFSDGCTSCGIIYRERNSDGLSVCCCSC